MQVGLPLLVGRSLRYAGIRVPFISNALPAIGLFLASHRNVTVHFDFLLMFARRQSFGSERHFQAVDQSDHIRALPHCKELFRLKATVTALAIEIHGD